MSCTSQRRPPRQRTPRRGRSRAARGQGRCCTPSPQGSPRRQARARYSSASESAKGSPRAGAFSAARPLAWTVRPGLLPRRGAFAAQQLVAGHAEYLRNDRNKRKIRRTVVAFPARNGFVRHVQPLRQLLLRHAVRAAQGREEAAHCFLFHKSDLLLVFGWLDSTAASERMPPNGAGLSLAVREFYSSPVNFGSSQPTSSGPRPTVMRAVGATM